MVKYFGLVRFDSNEEVIEVEVDSLKEGLKKLRSETVAVLKKAGLEDKEFKGLISFAADKETLVGYAGSNKPTSAKVIDESLVRLVKNEYLVPLNVELFELKKPLVIFPSIDLVAPVYPDETAPELVMVNHLEFYEKESRAAKTKTLLPSIEIYTDRYDVVPYTVVVSWGFVLRDLLRNNSKSLGLSPEEFATVSAFAEVAANMVHSRVWSSNRDGRFPSGAKTLNRDALIEAFHSYVASVVEEPAKVPYLGK